MSGPHFVPTRQVGLLSIMPESTCGDCRDTHWSTTRDGLKKWELAHHKASFKKAEEGSLALSIGVEGFHDCRIFQEKDDGTMRPVQIRIYNYNRLVEVQ